MLTMKSSVLPRIISATMMCLVLGYIASAGVFGYSPAHSQEQQASGFKTITSQQLVEMLTQKDFLLINVHVPYEGEIEGTDAFIPYDHIGEELTKLSKDKSAKLVLYCKSGRMSEIAAKRLSDSGYRQVSQLSGGMIAWKASGHALLRK